MKQGYTVTPTSGATTKSNPALRPTPKPELIHLTAPTSADAAEVHKLIAICRPLDLNSTYAYLLLCHHYSDSCVVARTEENIIGFVSGFKLPRDPETIFIWQVAVHPDARGARLGERMLQNLLKRSSIAPMRFMETTVSPSNEASRRMFQRLAKSLSAPINEQMLFDRAAFGNEDHEEEVLLKIGPFNMGATEKEMQ